MKRNVLSDLNSSGYDLILVSDSFCLYGCIVFSQSLVFYMVRVCVRMCPFCTLHLLKRNPSLRSTFYCVVV